MTEHQPAAHPEGLFVIGPPTLAEPPQEATVAHMGAKAHNLARMARLGLPVPPAFVLGTTHCQAVNQGASTALDAAQAVGLRALSALTACSLGDPRHPLLVSVRSGSPVSMPGMMETLLNIGLCDATVPGLLRQTGNPRLVWDAYRRLVACHGEVVHGVHPDAFEAAQRARFDGRDERELDFAELRELTGLFMRVHQAESGLPFPQDPGIQLRGAVSAVYASWLSDKARLYRDMHHIDEAMGTAVTVQQMVFGNGGGNCGAGVGFTRNPSSGEPGLWVDFLFNAQGEDVVSGRRSAHGHTALADVLPSVWTQLQAAAHTLEQAFGDMQDIEFTVQAGQLFLLQTRSGKRTPQATARIALDLLDEGVIDRATALQRVSHLGERELSQTRLAAAEGQAPVPLAEAASACAGVACGEVALDAARAEARHAQGANVVLVRHDAETADLQALNEAVGLLTERGARTSHAAVVARQLGKVCLVGCRDLHIDDEGRRITLGGQTLHEGELITLDGHTGQVHAGALRTLSEAPHDLLVRLQRLREAV